MGLVPTNVKIQLVESGVCGSASEFDIAGTGAVYINAFRGTLCFSSPTLGLTIRVEGRRERFTSRDKKGCKEECSSGGQVFILFCSNEQTFFFFFFPSLADHKQLLLLLLLKEKSERT